MFGKRFQSEILVILHDSAIFYSILPRHFGILSSVRDLFRILSLSAVSPDVNRYLIRGPRKLSIGASLSVKSILGNSRNGPLPALAFDRPGIFNSIVLYRRCVTHRRNVKSVLTPLAKERQREKEEKEEMH